MCGINGAFGEKEAFSLVKTGLQKIQERGKDGCGYYDGKIYHAKNIEDLPSSKKENIIGHVLHAIVHTVPQPLEEQGNVLAVNGEIYNWKELCQKYNILAENDAVLLLKLLNTLGIEETVEKIHGVYAFAYWEKNTLFLARDSIGVKPLWYTTNGKSLQFCSEKKGLQRENIQELNPRQILQYDSEKKTVSFRERPFFSLTKEEDGSQLKELLTNAIKMRIPEGKCGLLFSGGLDSVIIAKVLKDLGKDFICYTAATSENAADLVAAKAAAETLGLKLKARIVSKEGTARYLKHIVPLIEDNNVVKVGVALPLFIAAELAREDGNKVIFSGSGADELFAGYKRYKDVDDIKKLNKDCYSDLLKIYERNCYRDDVVTMNNNLELRVPFLDTKLVAYALQITPELKIKDGVEKYILRQLARELNIPETFGSRKKKAAQYGSGFDKVIEKLAKPQTKSAYLRSFYDKGNLKLGALISSGKDGWYAAHTMHKQNYDLTCIITMKSTNEASYMFHTPNVHLVELQAKAANIPLIIEKTAGEKETELADLERAIRRAKEEHQIDGIISGALYSNYQRERIEKIADKLGLKIFAPLWHIDQEFEMRQLLREGFTVVLSSIACDGLDKSWLGRPLTERDVDKIVELNKRIGLNVAFEGGEAESLVLDCPLFQKKLTIQEAIIKEESEHTAQLIVTTAELEEK